ncbi:hypothetical protein Tco_0204216 [Tanacetum coccineum]
MPELREDTFSGNKNDDAHEHVEQVLDIVNLFNIPGVSHGAVMLRVFHITLTGAAKRWVDRIPPGTIDCWDLLKNAFIQSTEASRETHDKIIQGLEGKVKTLANEVEGRANNKKFEECKTMYSENGLPLYTPFYYSPEEIEYFSSNSGFSDNEEQETNDLGMAEAVAALEATLKKKREEPKKVKHDVNYYVDPYEPPILFPKRLKHHVEEAFITPRVFKSLTTSINLLFFLVSYAFACNFMY